MHVGAGGTLMYVGVGGALMHVGAGGRHMHVGAGIQLCMWVLEVNLHMMVMNIIYST